MTVNRENKEGKKETKDMEGQQEEILSLSF